MTLFSISMLMSVSSPMIYLLIMRASGAGSEGLGWRWHCSFGISACGNDAAGQRLTWSLRLCRFLAVAVTVPQIQETLSLASIGPWE